MATRRPGNPESLPVCLSDSPHPVSPSLTQSHPRLSPSPPVFLPRKVSARPPGAPSESSRRTAGRKLLLRSMFSCRGTTDNFCCSSRSSSSSSSCCFCSCSSSVLRSCSYPTLTHSRPATHANTVAPLPVCAPSAFRHWRERERGTDSAPPAAADVTGGERVARRGGGGSFPPPLLLREEEETFFPGSGFIVFRLIYEFY